MVIKKNSIFTKKQKGFIVILSSIVDVIILCIISALIVIGLNDNSAMIKDKYYLIVILALLGTIPFGDLLSVISKRKSISFIVLRMYLSRKSDLLKIGIKINERQRRFCETIFGSNYDKRLIYIYGKENKGKSTAIFYLLKGLFINSQSSSDIPWVDSITFIDCTNNREEILEFFSMDESTLNRIKKFKDSLVVIDNIERLGNVFLDQNIGLFLSRKSYFIIIEDTYMDEPMCGLDALNDALCVYSFNTSILNTTAPNELRDFISKFDVCTRKIFFSLYFSSISSNFVLKKNIYDVLHISKKMFNKSLKKIQATGVFATFPFNTLYCYCFKKNDLGYIDVFFAHDPEYITVLKAYISSDTVDVESKWLCLLRGDISTITNMSQDERRQMFHDALYNGNYKGLYKELKIAIQNSPKKETIFLYEKAYLAFHVGNHNESTSCYKQLIDSELNLDKKKELMLRIIESSHGNPDETNMNMISSLINNLRQYNDFYSQCAKYWFIHIQSEKGEFLYEDMSTIRQHIAEYTNPTFANLQRSILMRTYTDEIRFRHILGHKNNLKLYSEFSNYLNSCSSKRKEYFSNLYIEANHIHYILLLEAVLRPNESVQDVEELARNAEYYYNNSLTSEYYDEKSKRATKIKLLDLKMMFSNFNYEETIRQINLFKMHSDLNKVGVHVAFCETLLIKALILDPSNFSNDLGINFSKAKMNEISKHYNTSKTIFKKYKNEYGIFRLEFIMGLFKMLVSGRYTEEKCFNELKNLLDSHSSYEKENKVIRELLRKKADDSITKMFLLSIIRAYPIILQ